MAQVQAACDRCGAALVEEAAYCERCGARTRRAIRLVGLAIRVELLFFAMIVAILVAFIVIYTIQR